jgi:hypothetical protein
MRIDQARPGFLRMRRLPAARCKPATANSSSRSRYPMFDGGVEIGRTLIRAGRSTPALLTSPPMTANRCGRAFPPVGSYCRGTRRPTILRRVAIAIAIARITSTIVASVYVGRRRAAGAASDGTTGGDPVHGRRIDHGPPSGRL